MNKVAILSLKELPIKCVSCKYQREVGIGNICILLDLDVDIDIMLDNRSINCPLISIDIDELEEDFETVIEELQRSTDYFNREKYVKSYNTIKTTIDKLKGTYKNEI